jgi:hypothetical protein
VVTPGEFEQALAEYAQEGALPIEVHEFSGDRDFSADGESQLDILRGSKMIFRSQLKFWLQCFGIIFNRDREFMYYNLPKEQWPDAVEALQKFHWPQQEDSCRKIPEKAMWDLVNRCLAGLRWPYKLELRGEFVAGILIADDWDEKYVLCETDQEYVYFHWETSA